MKGKIFGPIIEKMQTFGHIIDEGACFFFGTSSLDISMMLGRSSEDRVLSGVGKSTICGISSSPVLTLGFACCLPVDGPNVLVFCIFWCFLSSLIPDV